MAVAARNLDCIKVFRNSLVSFLKAANLVGVGENVYAARIEKAWPEEDAFIVVGIPNVAFADGRTSPRFYSASADVNIDIFAGALGSDPERGEAGAMADFLLDTAQRICELLEPSYNAKGPFDGSVKRMVLKSYANNLSEQDMMRGAMRIVFGIEFAVCINHSGPTDEFLKAENSLKMGNGDGNQQDFVTNLRP